MADGPPANIRLGQLVHEHGAHHPALHAAFFNGVLQRNGVDDRGQHAHAVGAHTVHLPGLLLHAAKEVAPAHHDADFDAKCVNLDDFIGNPGHLVGVKAEAPIPGQCLT